jgi:hypothetical protein
METILGTMMTSKTKKTRPDSFFSSRRHPFLSFNHPTVVYTRPALAVFVYLAAACVAGAGPSVPAPQSASASRAHDFVVFTTVFTDQGFGLFGARVRLRRAEEKKFRWEATADHQGELAFRVPEGTQYEMTVEARGFRAETRKIDATQGSRADLTIRMEPLSAAPAAQHADPSAGGKP